MEPWLSFYKPHFPSQLAAEKFVEACENLEPSGANHLAKIMMHQASALEWRRKVAALCSEVFCDVSLNKR